MNLTLAIAACHPYAALGAARCGPRVAPRAAPSALNAAPGAARCGLHAAPDAALCRSAGLTLRPQPLTRSAWWEALLGLTPQVRKEKTRFDAT